MPLIACPDCHREISDRAANCIHCGAPMAVVPGGMVGPGLVRPPVVEREIWSGGPSQWTALGYYLMMVIPCLVLIGIPFVVYRYLTIKSIRYSFTNQRLTVKTGIFNRSTEEVELFRVKDTSLDEPLVLRLYGLGDIQVVMTDATASLVVLHAVSAPEKVRLLLRDQVNEARRMRGTIAMEGI